MDLTKCTFPDPNGVVTIACAPIIVQNLLFWAISLAGVVALFLVIIGGFKFITSGGEKEKVEAARKTLTFAIIGLVLILISFGIVRFIGQLTGVTCISAPFDFSSCGLPGPNQ